MSSKKAGADGDPKAKKKPPKKKLIIILAAVLVLGGGGAGSYFMFFSGPSTPKPPEPGEVVPLDAITLNLAEGHFLKIRIALQATAEAAHAPDGSKALDITIDLFSNRTVAELSTKDARDKVMGELREKIVEAYEHEVMDVYLTEFVMQ